MNEYPAMNFIGLNSELSQKMARSALRNQSRTAPSPGLALDKIRRIR